MYVKKGFNMVNYHKLPLISPGLIPVRKGFWVGLSRGANIRMGL